MISETSDILDLGPKGRRAGASWEKYRDALQASSRHLTGWIVAGRCHSATLFPESFISMIPRTCTSRTTEPSKVSRRHPSTSAGLIEDPLINTRPNHQRNLLRFGQRDAIRLPRGRDGRDRIQGFPTAGDLAAISPSRVGPHAHAALWWGSREGRDRRPINIPRSLSRQSSRRCSNRRMGFLRA